MKRANHRGVYGAALICGLSGLLAAALAPTPARAQPAPGPDGTVTATGVATVERQPDVLRMQVDLSAEGKDAKEAMAKLKEQEKSAREKLAKLGAGEASVQFGDPQATAGDRRQQMEAMVRMRSGRGKAPATAPAAPAVTVSATLKAEWAVKSKTSDDLLVESQELQAKVKAAALVAAPGKAAATPEEAEEAEEQAAMLAQNGEGNSHEPVYLFVGKISDEDRAKATADAFKKAKGEAARLAASAGTDLGALRQLTSNAGPDVDASRFGGMMNDYPGNYQRYIYGAMQQQQQGGGPDSNEAIGIQPGKVSYKVMVSASFALK